MHLFSTIFHSPLNLRKTKGFTAIEIMVVIAILAIIFAIATPSFLLMIESMRTNNAMDEVQGVLMYARSEAVRNRNSVVVRRKASCRAGGSNNQDWSCGWVVFVDINGDNAQNATEPSLREMNELTGVDLMHRGGTSAAFVNFNSMGYANNTPGRFTAFPRGNSDNSRSSVRTLCMNRTASIRRVRGASC